MDRMPALPQAARPEAGVLLTDLYELTMLQAYDARGMNATAAFEFFVRAIPARRNFLMAAGLAQVVDYLASLRFEPDELEWLRGCGRFFNAIRDTTTDRIAATYRIGEPPP